MHARPRTGKRRERSVADLFRHAEEEEYEAEVEQLVE